MGEGEVQANQPATIRHTLPVEYDSTGQSGVSRKLKCRGIDNLLKSVHIASYHPSQLDLSISSVVRGGNVVL